MRAAAVAHPNVALIKYWGKRDRDANLPATGSLSIGLGGLSTRTTVTFSDRAGGDRVWLNGHENEAITRRVTACLDELRALAGARLPADVVTDNDFPTGAGLASSASGFAALVTAAAGALDLRLARSRLAEIARRGSGSAARSLYGGFVLLENTDGGTRCRTLLEAEAWPLSVVVAVTTTDAKAVGSTAGMERSRRSSPYYPAWVSSHAADLDEAVEAVERHDFERLAELSEHSCLKMHAVMISSRPPLLYWSAATVACMQRIAELRHAGVPVFFSIDAGPQVKAICTPAAEAEVAAALTAEPGVLRVVASPLGDAARLADPDD